MRSIKWILWITLILTYYICSESLSIQSRNIESNEILEHNTLIRKLTRLKRDPKGHSRGQTQSQYLNFGNPEQEGKAEAEATEQGSRAFVTGTHGMGQAQSQFSGGDCSGCATCVCDGYDTPGGYTDAYGRLLQPSATGREVPKQGQSIVPTGITQWPGLTPSHPPSITHPLVQPGAPGAETQRPGYPSTSQYGQPGYGQQPSQPSQTGRSTQPGYPGQPGQPQMQPGAPGAETQRPGYPGISQYGQPGYGQQPSQPGQSAQQGRPIQPDQSRNGQQPGQSIQQGRQTQPDQSRYGQQPGQTGTTYPQAQPGIPGTETQRPGYPSTPQYGHPGHVQQPGQQSQPAQPGQLSHTPGQPGISQSQVQPGLPAAEAQKPGYPITSQYGQPGYGKKPGEPGYVGQPGYGQLPTQPGSIRPQTQFPTRGNDTQRPGYPSAPQYGQPGYGQQPSQPLQPGRSTQSGHSGQPGYGQLPAQPGHPQMQPGAPGAETQRPGYPGISQYGQPGYGQQPSQPGQSVQQGRPIQPDQSRYGQQPGQSTQQGRQTQPDQSRYGQQPGQSTQQGRQTQPDQSRYGQLPGQAGITHPQAQPRTPGTETQRPGYSGIPQYGQPTQPGRSVQPGYDQTDVTRQQIQPGADIRKPGYPPSSLYETPSVSSDLKPICQSDKTQILTVPSQDGCGGLTVLVGTDGPHQTVIQDQNVQHGKTFVAPSSSGEPTKQTVYTPSGGLTVVVGTGGPKQTVYKLSPGTQSPTGLYAEPSTADKIDQNIPGQLLTPSISPLPSGPHHGILDSISHTPSQVDQSRQIGPAITTDSSTFQGGQAPKDFSFIGSGSTDGKAVTNDYRGTSTRTDNLKFDFAGRGVIWPRDSSGNLSTSSGQIPQQQGQPTYGAQTGVTGPSSIYPGVQPVHWPGQIVEQTSGSSGTPSGGSFPSPFTSSGFPISTGAGTGPGTVQVFSPFPGQTAPVGAGISVGSGVDAYGRPDGIYRCLIGDAIDYGDFPIIDRTGVQTGTYTYPSGSHAEQAGPSGLRTGPGGTSVGSNGFQSVPGGTQTIPNGFQMSPSGTQMGPTGIQTGFGGTQIGPGYTSPVDSRIGQISPGGPLVSPSGFQTIPTGQLGAGGGSPSSFPANFGGQTIPFGTQVIPSGIQTAPSGIYSSPTGVIGSPYGVQTSPGTTQLGSVPGGTYSSPSGVIGSPYGIQTSPGTTQLGPVPGGTYSSPSGVIGSPYGIQTSPGTTQLGPVPGGTYSSPSGVIGFPYGIQTSPGASQLGPVPGGVSHGLTSLPIGGVTGSTGEISPQYPQQFGTGTGVQGQVSPGSYVKGTGITGTLPTSVSSGALAPNALTGCNGACSTGGGITAGHLSQPVSDDSFSQAESSIKDGQAMASAQGKKAGGTAQTQVSGTYSGSGSFSANAMTSDNDRSANSQVSGSSDGALSQAQGSGGVGKSQSQVQLNSKTGGTTAQSQSSGHVHQSQSEVQANEKGGLADAQSSGPGQTSSQAQIGFKPQDNESENNNPVFNGGGEASAQSGAYSGQSQSQIHGKFKYGISYHGAAQSASGTKEQVASYREQNKELFQTISQFGNSQNAVTERVDAVYGPSVSLPQSRPTYSNPDLRLRTSANNDDKETDKPEEDGDYEEEDETDYEEEEDELDYPQPPIKIESKMNKGDNNSKINNESSINENGKTFSQNSATQKQQATISGDMTNKFSLVQKQNGRTSHYPSKVTTEKVPDGFRGTVNLEKKYHTRFLPSKHSSGKNTIDENNPKRPDSYVTVTKSVTGSLDTSKSPPTEKQNFSSTYYTKSSTCGYFTFSCNIVYGTNGRSKICRPKAPLNGKC